MGNEQNHCTFFLATLQPGMACTCFCDGLREGCATCLDEKLLDLFHFGRFILERKDDARVIARIGRTAADLKENQVEILELVTEEWVEP